MKTLFLVFYVAFATSATARQIQPRFYGESLQVQSSTPLALAWIKEILAPWTGWYESRGLEDYVPDPNYIP